MRRVLTILLALATAPVSAVAENAAVTIQVDDASSRHPIDPRVYGVNNGGASQLVGLGSPLNRLGGSHTSRYNWNVDAYNRANDYFFESIVNTDFGSPGKTADDFINASKGAGAEPIMTIPMVGRVARVGPNGETLCSFPTGTYPGQQQVDAQAGCGNGIAGNPPQPIAGNDPDVANVAADEGFERSFVQHIVGQFGMAANGGLKYYGYDNEPAIWHASHRDVHPDGAGMDEVLAKTLAYGHMIRTEDPDAVLLGPEEYNWDGYFNSGLDIKYYGDHDCANNPCVLPDRLAHGGADYVPWLTAQLHQHEVDTGERLLDVLAVHFYPQGDAFGHSEFVDNTHDAVDDKTQLLRNRSTRNLWDPNYVDESYIGTEGIDGGHDKLIPRLKSWVASYYPGIATGFTEYSWGADGHMNGATTQADILGIFGREGLDVAARWEAPPDGSPVAKAFRMYRNYDGAHSAFGEVSVSASASSTAEADPSDHVSVFAAERSSDGALTIMVVSKYLLGNTRATVDVANFASGPKAMAWRLQSNVLGPIADIPVSGGALSLTLPPQSITLLVLPNGPTLSVADAVAPEALSGTTTARFTVSLSGPGLAAVTVDYATANGTATAGLDYQATAGTLTFAPGITEQTVDVEVLGDALKEANETFAVTLSSSAGAAVSRAVATGTILDNSVAPKLQFSLPASVVSEATPKALIGVRRTGSLAGEVSVSYAAYDGTAQAPADYAPLGPVAGTLTFPPGVSLRTITVPLVNDSLPEGDETVLLRLFGPEGGALLGTQGTAVLTIRNDDPAGMLSVFPLGLRVAETLGHARITVRRTLGTKGTITVDYTTASGSAESGSDYTDQAGTLTFAPGQTTQAVTIAVAADGVPEGEEYFRLVLSNPTGGARLSATTTTTVTIAGTDPAVQFLSPTYAVGEGAAQAMIAVRRTGSLAQAQSVSYATSDGTAQQNLDYLPTTGLLSFPPGVATRAFAVKLLHDTVFAPPRTVMLSLSLPSVGVLGTSQAVLTIKDDDSAGTVQFGSNDITVSAGGGSATVKITRTGKLAAGQTVDLKTVDGTAVSGTDYLDASQTLTFAAGETTKLVTLQVFDDGAPGGSARSVALSLRQPAGGATVGPRGASTVWILENR